MFFGLHIHSFLNFLKLQFHRPFFGGLLQVLVTVSLPPNGIACDMRMNLDILLFCLNDRISVSDWQAPLHIYFPLRSRIWLKCVRGLCVTLGTLVKGEFFLCASRAHGPTGPLYLSILEQCGSNTRDKKSWNRSHCYVYVLVMSPLSCS